MGWQTHHKTKNVLGLKMEALQEAIAMNNKGVKLYESGGTSGGAASLPVFQRALEQLQAFSEDVAKNHCPLSWPRVTKPIRFGLAHQVGRCFKTDSNGQYFLYSRPLLIPAINDIGNLEELSAAVFSASTSMVFNMALAWHQLGETTGRDMCKSKAGQLYDAALVMLDSAAGASEAEDPEDLSLTVLKCLILNNRAQLYHEKCDYTNSQRCVDAMYDLLACSDALDAYLEPAEAAEVQWNMVYLKSLTMALAA